MLHQARRLLREPRIWQAMLAIYWLALFVSTHLPQATPLVPGNQIDKLVHMAAYAVLAGLFAATWQHSSGQLIAPHLRAAWIAIALYAAVDEWTQTFVGRDASAIDWLADVAGAAMGLALFGWLNPSAPPFADDRAPE
jgi:VanZ family protein